MDSTTIYRTEHKKYVTYTGDGSGRDGYVVFGNGGLHDLRNYQGSQPRSQFNNLKSVPKQAIAPRKEATAFDYVPDGSGRDSYVIFNYGLKANYRSSYREFEKGLRSEQQTPMMDARQAKRNDPWGTDSSSYRNWPSPSARHKNRQVFNEQRASIERLSRSPTSQRSRTKVNSIEKKEPMMPIPKIRANQTQMLKLADEMGREQFFASRNSAQSKLQSNTEINRAGGSSRKETESLSFTPKAQVNAMRTLQARKRSVAPTPTKKISLDLAEEDGNDYAPAFRKKMSVPAQNLHNRANTTLQYTTPQIGSAPRMLTTADPTARAGIRFKKVGNLMTYDKSFANGAARVATLSKTMGSGLANQNLFLRQNVSPQKAQNNYELEQLRQANKNLREKINSQTLQQARPAVSKNYVTNADYSYQQKSLTSMDRKPKQVTVAEEVRKGLLNSELRVKKMDTEVTKGVTTGVNSSMATSVNGTRFDQRRSIDRATNNLGSAGHGQEHEYGSINSPDSPIKVGRANLTMTGQKLRHSEAKEIYMRRNTTTAQREGADLHAKRSISVQQSNPPELPNYMAKTQPAGFFKPNGGAQGAVDSPVLRN